METEKVKYLGIIIDKNLKWTDHVNYLTSRVRRLIHKFSELRKFMNKKTLVESIIKYGILVWGGLYNNALNPLSVVQNFIL